MEERKKIEEPIVEELKRFNEEFFNSLCSSTNRLQTAIDQILKYSGKHIRPLMVLLTAKALGEVSDRSIQSAVMVELLHTSSLIHDDVIDETKQRRGVPSLNAIFDNRVSVLVGDYVLSSALLRCMLVNDIRIMGVLATIGRELSEGELQQLEAVEDLIIDENRYFQVIKKKTAILLSGCAEIGALSVESPDELVVKARQFGKYMGYSFQIKDDIFDYFDDPVIGKPTGNDIREGKITLPLLYALQKETEEGEMYYRDIILRQDFTSENVQALIDFAKSRGGIEYAEQHMNGYKEKAIQIIRTFPPSDARNSLLLLADYIVNRNK